MSYGTFKNRSENQSEMPSVIRRLCPNINFPPFRLLISALSISFLCVFQDGYHLSVINIPQIILEKFVNRSVYRNYDTVLNNSQLSVLWSFIANVYFIGGILGAWTTMYFAEKYGRKYSLLVINNVIAVLASILMGLSKLAQSMEMLTLGRLLIGYNSGLATGLLGMYLTECSPVKYRGLTASFVNLFITMTTLIAQVVSLPQLLGTEQLWPVLISLAGVPALIQLSTFWMFPESPKHLLLTSKNEEKARESIWFFHGRRADVQEVFEEFRKEQELAKEQLSLKEALMDFDLAWPIFMSAVINAAQVATGITAIFTYSTSIFLSVGVSEETAPLASMATSIFNLIGAFIALPLIDYCGRRPLMLFGLIACLICDLVFMIFSLLHEYNLSGSWASWICLVTIMIHVTVFNIGPGPIAWFISSESTPQSVRSIGASVSITVNWLTAMISGFLYLPLQAEIGAWSFLVFILPTTACTMFLWLKMPETKNRTIDEIMRTWSKKPQLHVNHLQLENGNVAEDVF